MMQHTLQLIATHRLLARSEPCHAPTCTAPVIPLRLATTTFARERTLKLTRKATSTLVSIDVPAPVPAKLTIHVHPIGKGGISTFANKDKSWADNKTWVLERATELISGLAARNDHGSLWSIEPSAIMKFDAYKGHLTQLNGKAVRYDRLHEHRSLAKEVEAEETPVPEPRTLKGQSTHSDRATRFVYNT